MGQVKMLRSVRKRELLPLGLAGTLRIDLLGQLEGVRVGQVHVGGGDGKNEAALPADELQDHVLDLVLDILGLVPHGHLGDAWEVNEGQVQHYGGNQRERGRQELGAGEACTALKRPGLLPPVLGIRPQDYSCVSTGSHLLTR